MRVGPTLALLSLSAFPPVIFAGTIPYNNAGTIAPTVPTYASGSGGISIYYFGSTAGFTDYVEVRDLQTGYNSHRILDNKTTSLGDKVTIGNGVNTSGRGGPMQINAGDQLVFYIISPEGKLASIPSYSADGDNHAYITDYAAGSINWVPVPAGLFVGLEDEAAYNSDFNYNDDTFVFTGVSAPSIASAPEPSSLALLGTGLLSFGALLRRRLNR